MLDIATATIKILAQPDQPVSLARTALTANTAQMAAKARTDHQERFPTGITLSKKDHASNARPGPKDHPDHPDRLDQLPSPADPVAKATTANPAAPARLVPQAMLAPPDPTANLARKANRVLMSNSEAKDRLVPKVKKEVLDQLAPMEKKDPLASPAPLARLAHPADLAKEAKMAQRTKRPARPERWSRSRRQVLSLPASYEESESLNPNFVSNVNWIFDRQRPPSVMLVYLVLNLILIPVISFGQAYC